ncbi:MAG: ABC transporter substrate-binding protein [Chlorobi bacterium]|nr:ABC transporter substrate-binding protein [Chlorobiota bacterium]
MRFFLALTFSLLFGTCSENNNEKRFKTNGSLPTKDSALILVDAYKDTISLDNPPKRFISLAPNLTEVVYFLNGERGLVGRTDYCDYPPAVDSVPSIGTLGFYNYESMVALRPDLILMMTFDGSSKGEYDRLKELGLRPFAIAEGSINDVINGFDTVGIVLGRKHTAGQKTDSLRRIVMRIEEKAASYDPVSTFIVIDKSPLMTTSGGFIGSVIESAGGRNIAADDPIPHPTYSRELLLRQDPEVILVPSSSEKVIDEFITMYPEWQELRAYKEKKIRTIPQNLIARPSPRIVDGLQQIFRILHPDL